MRLYNPVLYQGKNKKAPYFEGWYYKLTEPKSASTLAIIPGITKGKNPHSFIQVIHGSSGKTWYNRYTVDDFSWTDKPFTIHIGPNEFARNYISLSLIEPSISGTLYFTELKPYPGHLLSPGIMGPFSFLPFMECYHGVISMDHMITGNLDFDNHKINFTGGRGYIEKDWGRSFPSSWVWIQGNQFSEEGNSLLFSLARIPWIGNNFNGFICFLLCENQLYTFNTYNKSKISILEHTADHITILITRKKWSLQITAKPQSLGCLQAPVEGNMNRTIKESCNAFIEYSFKREDTLLSYDKCKSGGCEISGDTSLIF
ncbi:tocopherol cyclase family protein [Spirochaeta cellobiosiphila]|uniref:tocopherol cyclase family protein n=1 Tax=Spirochaeta cellobiosiphila TaxID=504483 RepID=UPI0004071652|nr:tocopherol cyclase family protein [Spirochaeta cellobiosiphila]